MRVEELNRIAAGIRAKVVQMSHEAKAPHLGSSLSCVDILAAAGWSALRLTPENPTDPDRDRLILSKGHAAAALYAMLVERGFFPGSVLDEYNAEGGRLQEHPGVGSVPGIEVATGSLGHGLPLGLGMALAGRLQGRDYRVLVVMSDGECNEGSVWEGALFAAAQQLGRVTVVVDYNKWQATGRSNEVMSLNPLKEKWTAFGWDAIETDGHDMNALIDALSVRGDDYSSPRAVIAHTVKGKGVSFMEDDNNWHYRIPTEEEVQKARHELLGK